MNTLTEGSAKNTTIETPSVTEEEAAVSPPVATSTTVLPLPTPALDVGTPFTPPEGPSTDTPLRDIPIALLNGETLRLSDLKGKVVVLNFWASWCPPCRRESPLLERTWRAYADQGVLFVGVDIQDNPEDAQAYLDEFDLTFPNGTDGDGRITVDYGVIGLPITFFIGAGGIVEGRFVGALREDRLVGWVESLIAGMPQPREVDDENLEGYFSFE